PTLQGETDPRSSVRQRIRLSSVLHSCASTFRQDHSHPRPNTPSHQRDEPQQPLLVSNYTSKRFKLQSSLTRPRWVPGPVPVCVLPTHGAMDKRTITFQLSAAWLKTTQPISLTTHYLGVSRAERIQADTQQCRKSPVGSLPCNINLTLIFFLFSSLPNSISH
ncbi:unnamed protein product, partial [Ectocarpus sp. 12 AP-2014]